MERSPEERREILKYILDEYGDRKGTQAEIATKTNERSKTNERYGTALTPKDVGSITRQEGYYHTVLRDTLTTVLVKLDDTTIKHLG